MTRGMMANVSELSMQHATSMRLQQEIREKEATLERYCINMPPSVDVEQEFLRQIQLEERRQHDSENAKQVTRATLANIEPMRNKRKNSIRKQQK